MICLESKIKEYNFHAIHFPTKINKLIYFYFTLQEHTILVNIFFFNSYRFYLFLNYKIKLMKETVTNA